MGEVFGNEVTLRTDSQLNNGGSIRAEQGMHISSKQLGNNGCICGNSIDLKETEYISNKNGAVLQATSGDILLKKKLKLNNCGRIVSPNLNLDEVEFYGQCNGELDVASELRIDTNQPLSSAGIIHAPRFIMENTSRGTIDLSRTLRNAQIVTDIAILHFLHADVENKSNTVLGFNAQIFAPTFHNFAILQGKHLSIETAGKFINGCEYFFEEPQFNMEADWDIEHTPALQVARNNSIDLSPHKISDRAVISAEGDLSLKSSSAVVKNTGTIKTAGHLSIAAPLVQHGWAHESVHHESLPELEFDYDFLEAQPSYMIAEKGAEINASRFLNTFGTIDVHGGLRSVNPDCFFNYAGDICVSGGCEIKTGVFANLIGTVKTSRPDHRYWSIEFCNTDPASFNVVSGGLRIDTPHAFNSGSYLYAKDGVFLCGTRDETLQTSVIDIASRGFGYTRMYSVNEYNRGKYADRILGMGYASTGLGAVIRAELNESVKKRILPASVSSSQKVIIDNYRDLRSDGIIHGKSVHIKTGNGTTQLGYTGDAILPSVESPVKRIELYPYISLLADRETLAIADVQDDFHFRSSGGNLQIPFTVIDNGTDITQMKLPFSLEVMEAMLLRQVQRTLGTGYIPDMPTLADAARIAADSVAVQQRDRTDFLHLKHYTSAPVSIVTDENATRGLFFRPQKVGDFTLLFPELRIPADFVHAALSNSAGATVAQGDQEANVIIDTAGFLHATSSIHADDHIKVKADGGTLFETTTYDAMGITQNVTATTSRGFLGIGGDTTYHKLTEWHQVKVAREPMLATTTRGDFIIILPDDQESAEFKGMFADIAGNFEVYGGTCILSPLEVAEVVTCPRLFGGGLFGGGANRISTLLPVFLKTVLKSSGDFIADVRVFKNTAGKIHALGNVHIKATDKLEFNTESRKFTLAEGTEVDEGVFSTRVSSRKVEDVMFAAPEVNAGQEVKLEADSVDLSGTVEAQQDIKINARLAKLKSELAYGTDEFHSRASNMFASAAYNRFATFARVSPTVFKTHGDFIVDVEKTYLEQSIRKECKNERIRAATIDSSPLRAHETVIESSSSHGFSIFMPSSVMSPICDGNIEQAVDAFWRGAGILTSTQNFLHSRRGAEIAANGISVALSAYSSLKTIQKSGGAGIASLFGIGDFGFYSTQTRSVTERDFTIASETIASGCVDWLATSGDIRITHRMAKAGGDQRYTAAGKIEVRPGEYRSTTTRESSSVNGTFNVFTMDANIGYNTANMEEKTTEYQPSMFVSSGDNVFSAGNGIHIVIPQIEGKRNTFDAFVVQLENRANEREVHASSSGIGLSTNLVELAGMMAAANLGGSSSHDAVLNDAYVRGAVDFMHSRVKNQGCLVMNITNAGASYEYVPMEDKHESENFAICLSGLDVSSADAFAYSLGRSLASSAASAGVGLLASEAGLGGFVSTLAASLAGAYVNSEVMPQMCDAKHTPTGLGSNGSVSYEHNGEGFRAINVEFDRTELNKLLNDIKTEIFGKALDEGLPTQDAVQIVKDSETALQEAFHVAETTEVALQNIDEHETSVIQDKIVEVPDDAPTTVKRRAERENLDILSSSVRNAAQQKVRVLDQQIAIVEAKKTEISSKLRQTPGVKETVTTVFDSLLDGLKAVRDGCVHVVRNPMETIEHAYDVTTSLGKKAVNTVSETGRFVWNNPSEALDLATSELSSMYSAAKDDVFGTSLNLAEYAPCGIGALVEGGRDVNGVWFAKDRELRSVIDKWRNYGLIGVIGGKGAKKAAKEVFEIISAPGKFTAKLTRYGGSGGGHHIHMKSAYKSHSLYDLNEALCLSNEEMMRLGINHLKVTAEQRRLCIQLNKTGKTLTREEMNRISVEALVAGGADEQLARNIVARSQWDLKEKGVRVPTDMPFMRNKK